MAATAPRPVIVAGVDGFNDSKEALRWAARQARLTGAEVHAVTAWHVPFRIYAMPSHNEADYARDARQTLDTAVRDALGPDPDVPVVTRLVQQRPAIALVEEAAHADLLVVGVRGHGELPGMHLGAVASYCTHHAPCPVVVVHQAGLKDAVTAYRELTAAQPVAFRPDLAATLANQCVQLAGLGRWEEALTAIEEAVAIRRELTAARPDAFRPGLAMSLNTQSNCLADLGRQEEALAAIEEAVTAHRELVAAGRMRSGLAARQR